MEEKDKYSHPKNKITVKCAGGKWHDTFHCKILEDNEKDVVVKINNELVMIIKKYRIIKNDIIKK